MNSQHVPIEFRAIDEDEEIIYVAQCRLWTPKLGIPQDPLHNYSGNSQWKQQQGSQNNWQQPNQAWEQPNQGWQQPNQGWQ